MAERPRVLVVAEAANPDWVSVPLVGWSLAAALREVAEVHLVTQVRNRAAILRAGRVEGADFTVIDSEAVARPAMRLAGRLRGGREGAWTLNTAIEALSYPHFERLVWRRFGAEIRAGRYDIVHRVTPVSPTVNGPLAARCRRAGVPFVLGPVNGGVPWPPGFESERRREREWLAPLRSAYRALPASASTAAASAAILAGSRHTLSELPRAAQARAIWLPENAIDPARFPTGRPRPLPRLPLRAAFVGRLVPYKGPDMALEAALPLLSDGRLTLDIVGDGPLRGDLERRVAEHTLANAVTFHGRIPHRQVHAILGRADLLTFPSIREFGGAVVLEAMALRAVPVVVDYAGPGELVTEASGIALPLGRRGEIVARLRAVLERAAAEPAALAPLAEAGRRRVTEGFTWSAKARQIADVYGWVLGRRAEKPDFSGL